MTIPASDRVFEDGGAQGKASAEHSHPPTLPPEALPSSGRPPHPSGLLLLLRSSAPWPVPTGEPQFSFLRSAFFTSWPLSKSDVSSTLLATIFSCLQPLICISDLLVQGSTQHPHLGRSHTHGCPSSSEPLLNLGVLPSAFSVSASGTAMQPAAKARTQEIILDP